MKYETKQLVERGEFPLLQRLKWVKTFPLFLRELESTKQLDCQAVMHVSVQDAWAEFMEESFALTNSQEWCFKRLALPSTAAKLKYTPGHQEVHKLEVYFQEGIMS